MTDKATQHAKAKIMEIGPITIRCMDGDSTFEMYAEIPESGDKADLIFISGEGISARLTALNADALEKMRHGLVCFQNEVNRDGHPLDDRGIDARCDDIVSKLLLDCHADGVTDGTMDVMKCRIRGLIHASMGGRP